MTNSAVTNSAMTDILANLRLLSSAFVSASTLALAARVHVPLCYQGQQYVEAPLPILPVPSAREYM